MTAPKEVYIIVCEGGSEKAYLQEINRYLDINDYPFTFVAKPINNGHFKPAKIKYREVKEQNPKNNICIWVDKDTYIRNDEGDREKYLHKPKDIPNFMFNYQNFEDFLAMHMPDDILQKWQKICHHHNHFEHPLHAETYIPLYRQHVNCSYEKATMPFAIDKDNISNALKNQKDSNCRFRSDFLDFLKTLIEK